MVAPLSGGDRAWSLVGCSSERRGGENVRQGPWVDVRRVVGSGANCPPPAGTLLGAIPQEGDVERLKVPVFGGGDEDTGSTVADVGILASGGGAGGGAKEASEPPFILSDGLPPVPPKLVKKIQRGDYVDMAELFRDNMELGRRHPLDAGLGGGARPARREVPDLLSWIACFGMYASVVAQKCPNRVRELWAYQTMVVHEARRCGGKVRKRLADL